MSSLAKASVTALFASALVAGTTIEAQAQAPKTTPVPGLQIPPQPRPGADEPRQGESYEPIGVRVGGFRLFPALELAEQYDTNIFATQNRKQDDLITVIRPSLDLRSNWNNHMLNLFASGAVGLYADHTSENYKDVRVGFDGRLDVQRNWYLYGGAQFNHMHEDRADPNATSFGKPNEYNLFSGNLGYYQKFNRLSIKLDGRMDDYAYTNNRGAVPGVITNRDRDRREYTESLRIAYEFIDKYEVWVQGGLNQRNYDRRVDSAGFRRSSDGWEVTGGATIDFGGITQVEAFVGYRDQEYDDSRLGSIRGPVFGLTGYWNPLVPLMIKPYVKRTIEETVLTTHTGFWATAFGLDVDYDLRPNIKLTGGLSYTKADYKKARSVPSFNRDDDYMRFEIGLRYLPTENFFIGPSYRFTSRDSNLSGNDFSRHLFSIRAGARL
jgi:hypothetical protein